MAHDLHQLLEEVTDEASFLRFIQARSEDGAEPGARAGPTNSGDPPSRP
ncbi:hypothetical protein HMI51_12040 [Corallococcus coralloides]|nr:hypothetical protein [Corallococcus sp. CA049B]NOJ93660.1 hypothetical protein [Corallococcus coralloides]